MSIKLNDNGAAKSMVSPRGLAQPPKAFGVRQEDIKQTTQVDAKPCLAGSERVRMGFGNVVASLRDVYDPETARKAIGLTMVQMGQALADLTGRPRPFSKSAIATYEWWGREQPNAARPRKFAKKYAPQKDVFAAYRKIIANTVRLVTGGIVVARPRPGRYALEFTVLRACTSCGRLFELQRSTNKRCPRCRKG